MKLISLYIENFGGLKQYSLDFNEGLTVIREPNGFGKTTLAEFIRTMFYGFPRSTKNSKPREKYTPWTGGSFGGTVTLGAGQAENGVRFYVKDTGIGMDEETKRLAFERFHQAEKGRSDKGSGLGLSIAREVLMKLGVEIQLESELGKGSEFAFVIPDGGNSALPAAVS